MKKGLVIFGAIALIVIILVSSVIGMYNGLVATNENIDGKWSQVENNLQRRADLIPNFVNTVKGYATHEKEIFTEVANARSRLIGAKTVDEAANANNDLSNALSRLLVISEAYPELKANQNFIQLQDELAGTENRIATARKDYNDAVQGFNSRIKSFPTNLFSRMFGFAPREYFKADEGSQKAPEVDFNS